MTSVLIITNKNDITADFIVKDLIDSKISFYRFNTEELTISVNITLDFMNNAFFLFDKISKTTHNLLNFTSIYYRRPKLPDLDHIKEISNAERNLLKNEILYTLEGVYKILQDAYWISPLYSIREAENKIYQLITAKQIGFDTPCSIISNYYQSANDFISSINSEIIIKPIKTGLIEDSYETSVIFTSKLGRDMVLKEEVAFCPIFLQNNVKKKADIRVTIVGEEVFGTRINSQDMTETETDWRQGGTILEHTKINIPNDIKEKCILLLKKLRLRFGAIDFILDNNNKFIFLEINPNGQWAWIEKQVGHQISKAIVKLLVNETF